MDVPYNVNVSNKIMVEEREKGRVFHISVFVVDDGLFRTLSSRYDPSIL